LRLQIDAYWKHFGPRFQAESAHLKSPIRNRSCGLFFATVFLMKKATTISLSLIAVAATGVLIYRARRRRQLQMRDTIANEGYETAPDILYPSRRRGLDELYGPVLP
jgi:hypothetical protein